MENVKYNGVKLGLYATQWMNCVNDPQVLAWDTSKEDAVHRAVALAEKYCIENAKEAIAAAEPVARDVLMTALNEMRDACSFAVSGDIGVKSADKVMAGVDIAAIVDRYVAQLPVVPDGYKLVPIEQRQLLESVSSLEKRLEMMIQLAKQQSMQLNLLRIKCGEYTLVERTK